MDDRGRLVQSLKLILQRRAPAARQQRAHGWSPTDWPAYRLARRWLTFLFDLPVPRGAGASAAALLLLASTCYGVVKGDHTQAIVAQIQDICDTAANSVGFRITEVALAGEHQVSREDILALAGVTGRSSLLFLDAGQTRIRLLTNPWIAEAAVLKLYPGRLRIAITERKAFALWQKEGRLYLIAADGTVLETYVPPRFAALPLVVGDGAEHGAKDFLHLLKRLSGHRKIGRRRGAGRRAALEPALEERRGSAAAGARAGAGAGHAGRSRQSKKLLSRDIVTVDLRLADRVTVRQSDAAAAARDEALKAAEKDKKAKAKKSKGHEA